MTQQEMEKVLAEIDEVIREVTQSDEARTLRFISEGAAALAVRLAGVDFTIVDQIAYINKRTEIQ